MPPALPRRRRAPRSLASRLAVGLMAAGAIVVTGEIVPGVECPAIRTADGRTIALSRLPGPFRIGDRVTVTGSGYAGSSTCQQEVLVVTEVTAAD